MNSMVTLGHQKQFELWSVHVLLEQTNGNIIEKFSSKIIYVLKVLEFMVVGGAASKYWEIFIFWLQSVSEL